LTTQAEQMSLLHARDAAAILPDHQQLPSLHGAVLPALLARGVALRPPTAQDVFDGPFSRTVVWRRLSDGSEQVTL